MILHRALRSWPLLVASVALVTPALGQEPTHEVILSENPGASIAGFASIPGGGVYVTWSESVPVGGRTRNVLIARRLTSDLATLSGFAVVDDHRGPETDFQCPVVTRLGADHLAFAWLATTRAGRRIAYRVTTAAGVPVGPVAYADEVTPGRDAACPQIGGWARGFAIAWPSGSSAEPEITFHARSFAENGKPVSPRLDMQREAPGAGFPPGLAVDSRGHFTVAWTLFSPSGGSPSRLKMRRFLRNGIPTARTVEVDRSTSESAALSTFGRGENEGVEIAWRSVAPSGEGTIRVQRFDRRLQPLAAPREVADSNFFGLPSLRIDGRGRSALAWEPAGTRMNGLYLKPDLSPCGPPFPVQKDRAVGIATLAFSGPEEVAVGLLEEGADAVRRFVVRTYPLEGCGAP